MLVNLIEPPRPALIEAERTAISMTGRRTIGCLRTAQDAEHKDALPLSTSNKQERLKEPRDKQ